MIGTLTFIVAFVLLGVAFKVFNPKNYFTEPDKYGDKEVKSSMIIKLVVVILVSIILGIVNPISIQRIDAGNVGLKIDRVGNSKGIPVAIPVKGWVFYNSWISDVVEYSIRQNHVSYQDFSVTTRGGFPIKVAPSFNYSLKPEKAAELYINLLKGGSFSSLENNWLQTATNIALANASNSYTIDSIFNHKQQYQEDVTQELNRELSAYFIVSQINPGVAPPQELADVIKAKTEAIQKAQQAELDKITAVADAETKIARAKGDSAQAVITAAGEAEAIRLKTREISPTYVEYIRWVNASKDVPRVPSTVLGSGTSVIYNSKN